MIAAKHARRLPITMADALIYHLRVCHTSVAHTCMANTRWQFFALREGRGKRFCPLMMSNVKADQHAEEVYGIVHLLSNHWR